MKKEKQSQNQLTVSEVQREYRNEIKSQVTHLIIESNMLKLSKELNRWSKIQGFKCNWSNTPEKLMLIVTEVAEAMEAYRVGDKANFTEELADIIIRTLDLSGGLGIDIQLAVYNKMLVNFDRPFKHGKKC